MSSTYDPKVVVNPSQDHTGEHDLVIRVNETPGSSLRSSFLLARMQDDVADKVIAANKIGASFKTSSCPSLILSPKESQADLDRKEEEKFLPKVSLPDTGKILQKLLKKIPYEGNDSLEINQESSSSLAFKIEIARKNSIKALVSNECLEPDPVNVRIQTVSENETVVKHSVENVHGRSEGQIIASNRIYFAKMDDVSTSSNPNQFWTSVSNESSEGDAVKVRIQPLPTGGKAFDGSLEEYEDEDETTQVIAGNRISFSDSDSSFTLRNPHSRTKSNPSKQTSLSNESSERDAIRVRIQPLPTDDKAFDGSLEKYEDEHEAKHVIAANKISFSDSDSSFTLRNPHSGTKSNPSKQPAVSKESSERDSIRVRIQTLPKDDKVFDGSLENYEVDRETKHVIAGNRISFSDSDSSFTLRNPHSGTKSNPSKQAEENSQDDVCLTIRSTSQDDAMFVNTIDNQGNIYTNETSRVLSGNKISSSRLSLTNENSDVIYVKIKPVNQGGHKQRLQYDGEGEIVDESLRVIGSNKISLTSESETSTALLSLNEQTGGSGMSGHKHNSHDADTAPSSIMSQESMKNDRDMTIKQDQLDSRDEDKKGPSARNDVSVTIGGKSHPQGSTVAGRSESKRIHVKEISSTRKDPQQDGGSFRHGVDRCDNKKGCVKHGEASGCVVDRQGHVSEDVTLKMVKFQPSTKPEDYKPYPNLARLPYYARIGLPKRWGVEDIAKKRGGLKGLSCPPHHHFTLDEIFIHTEQHVRRYYHVQDCSLDGSNWVRVVNEERDSS